MKLLALDGRRMQTAVVATEAEREGLIKALGLVAWADERLADEERAMLDQVMDALEIAPERRVALCEAMRAAPPTVDEVAAMFQDEGERRFALAQAIMMAQVDGDYDDSERAQIDALAKAFDVEADELAMIHEAVQITGMLVSVVD